MMLTITEEFLQACPLWGKAGWKAGDILDASKLTVLALIIPPHKPNT